MTRMERSVASESLASFADAPQDWPSVVLEPAIVAVHLGAVRLRISADPDPLSRTGLGSRPAVRIGILVRSRARLARDRYARSLELPRSAILVRHRTSR